MMTAAVHASVRRHAPELANPFPPSDETLVAGGKIFLNECAGCHGTPGKATDYSDTLYPPAPQLSKVGTQYTEVEIFWIANYGKSRFQLRPRNIATGFRESQAQIGQDTNDEPGNREDHSKHKVLQGNLNRRTPSVLP
jgi:mono/diheme cytochrome c family protein